MSDPEPTHSLCVLCESNPSSTRGEDVIPLWLIKDQFPNSEGPYTTVKNGKPVPKKGGAPRRHDHLPRLLLPVCNDTDDGPATGCNSVLNDRFERPAKSDVQGMIRGDRLSDDQVRSVGLWWLKTVLLSHHPDVRSSAPDPGRPVWERPLDQRLFSWMVDGGEPPANISVWLSRQPDSVDRSRGTYVDALYLPDFEYDGATYRSHGALFGITDLRVTALVHPGWTTVHPLEATGHAVRIWPWDGGELDMADVAPCGAEEAQVLSRTLGPSIHLTFWPDFDPFAEPMNLLPGWWDKGPLNVPGVRGAAPRMRVTSAD